MVVIKTSKIEEDGHENGGKRHLEARHIQMIAIGGTIGSFLCNQRYRTLFKLFNRNFFCWSNRRAYSLHFRRNICILRRVCFHINSSSSLGEMATLVPVSGSFATYAARFVDPALGFLKPNLKGSPSDGTIVC